MSFTPNLCSSSTVSYTHLDVYKRQVLIPGYTDDESDLLELKSFLGTLSNVQKVELLPYHSMGEYKWKKLGLKYDLDGVKDATNNDIDRAKKILGI